MKINNEFLPANIGERIRDLRKSNSMTQAQFANAIGISESTVSRIENKSNISSVDILKIAEYFNVSVEFLLCKTDYPNVINYDLKILGLTEKAAKKLYNGQVDAGVLNLLIEHEKCGILIKLITIYLQGTAADGRKTQNYIYKSVSDFLRSHGNSESADTVAALTEPVYAPDIINIHKCLDAILEDIKRNIEPTDNSFNKETETTVNQLVENCSKQIDIEGEKNAGEFVADLLACILSTASVSEENASNLRDALVPVFVDFARSE